MEFDTSRDVVNVEDRSLVPAISADGERKLDAPWSGERLSEVCSTSLSFGSDSVAEYAVGRGANSVALVKRGSERLHQEGGGVAPQDHSSIVRFGGITLPAYPRSLWLLVGRVEAHRQRTDGVSPQNDGSET